MGFENTLHVRSGLARQHRAHAGEIGLGYSVEFERECVGLQASKRVGDVIDGVVGCGLRAVAPGTGGGKLIVAVELLGSLHVKRDRLAMIRVHAPGIGVEHERRVDQVAVVLEQPIDTIRLATFLVGGERQDEVAIRLEP